MTKKKAINKNCSEGRILVYIAGPYSADNTIKSLENIRAGLRAWTELMIAGYSPLCPFTDFLACFMLREKESLTINDYYESTLEWVKVSQAILVLPNWVKSKGVLNELNLARQLGIPIFFSIKELDNKFKTWRKHVR